MSATTVLESGRNVTKAAKEVTLTPPFGLACQLVANTITPSDLVEEQNRNLETICKLRNSNI